MRVLNVPKRYVCARASQSKTTPFNHVAFQTHEDDIRDAFEKFGRVTDVFIPKDRETGKPKGFAFVTLSDKRDADDAVAGLDGFAAVFLSDPHLIRLLQPRSRWSKCDSEPRTPP